MLQKILGTVILFFLLCGSFGFAQESKENVDNMLGKTCSDYIIETEGFRDIKKGVEQNYTLITSQNDIQTEVEYEIRKGEKLLKSNKGESILYTFNETGTYSLKVLARYDERCISSKEYPIHVYTTLYTYLGTQIEEFRLAREGAKSEDILVREIILETVQGEEFTKILADESYYLEKADVLMIEGEFIDKFFDALSTLQKIAGISIRDADFYVLADINQSAFRRMLARYHGIMGIEQIYVIAKQHMGSLFSSLFLKKDVNSLSIVKTYAVSLDHSNKWLFISYVADYLLQHGFPISTLLFILMLPFLVLLISIFRQVVGLSVFGVFNPLVFALSLYILGFLVTGIFFISAFLATVLLRMFTKKIYLLYSAKISLLIVLYSLFLLIILWIVHVSGLFILDYSIFQNTYIMFPFLFLVMVGNRVFSEKFYLFDKGWGIGLLEFFLVSTVIYFVISSSSIQNLVLGYPEISLASLFVLVLVGRFTGLQILEYVRFMPLIKNYFEEE